MKLRFEIELEFSDPERKSPPRHHTREYLTEELRQIIEEETDVWVDGLSYEIKKVSKLDP